MSYRAQSGTRRTCAPTVQAQLAPKLAWPTPPKIQLRAWGFVVSRISGLELVVSELDVSSQSIISFCLECLAPRFICCDCCEPYTHAHVICFKTALHKALDLVRQLQTTTSQLIQFSNCGKFRAERQARKQLSSPASYTVVSVITDPIAIPTCVACKFWW